MPTLRFIKKVNVVIGGKSLELTVTKTLGPVDTSAEVGSTGSDDASFKDSQLTPGPAVMPLNTANTYAIVWIVAFVHDGSATLRVRVLDAQGAVLASKNVTVQGKAGQVIFRAVLVP